MSRRSLIEPLENRQFLSTTVDLRLAGGAKSATVTSVGQVINLELWATVKGVDATGSNEALQSLFGSLLSTNLSGGAANGTLLLTPAAPFNGPGTVPGFQVDLDADGDLDVGSNDNSTALGFAFLRSGTMNGTGTVSGTGKAFLVATAQFTVTSLKSTTGQTDLVFRPRASPVGALWQEDGTIPYKHPEDGSIFQSGTPFVLKLDVGTTLGSIAGKVFNDADKDNTPDATESGLANVKVFIDKDADGVLDTGEPTSTTNSMGNFSFSSLAAGAYRVREVAPSGFKVTSPSVGYFDITLATGQNVTGRDFANQSTATTTGGISGKVFNDTDNDSILDIGETGWQGVMVYLDKDKDGIFDATELNKITDSIGNYNFTGLIAGSYRVRIVGVSGYRTSAPSSGYYDLTVGASGISGKNFGLTQKVLISGKLWVDTDNDGIKDLTETALSGWKVFIDKDKDGVLDVGELVSTTDASGNYSFKTLSAGSYRVHVVQPVGYTRLAPSSGYYDLTLTSGQKAENKNFRYGMP